MSPAIKFTERPKAQLWVIDCTNPGYGRTGYWSDDNGGFLFVSPDMAQRALDKWAHKLPAWAEIKPCNLDDDLAQMAELYNEGVNKS